MTTPPLAAPVSGGVTNGDGWSYLARRAVRRGILGMPVGLIAGVGMAFLSDNPTRPTEEVAAVLGMSLGFMVVPALLASLAVARAVGRTRPSGFLRTLIATSAAGLGWGLIGSVLTFLVSRFTTIDLPVLGLVLYGVGLGLGLGVATGLVAGAIRAIRSRPAEDE